jgi:hypothetical protein
VVKGVRILQNDISVSGKNGVGECSTLCIWVGGLTKISFDVAVDFSHDCIPLLIRLGCVYGAIDDISPISFWSNLLEESCIVYEVVHDAVRMMDGREGECEAKPIYIYISMRYWLLTGIFRDFEHLGTSRTRCEYWSRIRLLYLHG